MNDPVVRPVLREVDPDLNLIDLFPVPYCEIGGDGIIQRANQAAAEVFHRHVQQIIGHFVWEFVAPDEARESRESFLCAIEMNEDPPVVRRSFISDRGRIRTYELFRRMIRDESGKPLGMTCAMIDITERLLAHAEAREARTWLENILASVGEAVVVTDALGFIRFMNAAAEQITGWTQPELLGKVIEKALPMLRYEPLEGDYLTHRSALAGRVRGIATVSSRSLVERRVELTATPIIDKDSGYTVGVVTMVRPAVDVLV